MFKQFPEVGCQFGAPIGRREYQSGNPLAPKSVRLFRVNLDSWGYDDGGAYWGLPRYNLWCATDEADYRQFIRAPTRYHAARMLGLSDNVLKKGVGTKSKL